MLEAILFYLFAGMTLAGAFSVAFSNDLRRSAIALLLCFCGIAGLFFVLRAEFLAAMQLLLFVGGMTVLLMTGLLMTASAIAPESATARRRSMIFACLIALAIGLPLVFLLARTPWETQPRIGEAPGVERLGQALISGHRYSAGSGGGDEDAYLVPLELSSVLLLTVIVGASYLARPQRPAAPSGPPHIETLAPSPMLPRRGTRADKPGGPPR